MSFESGNVAEERTRNEEQKKDKRRVSVFVRLYIRNDINIMFCIE